MRKWSLIAAALAASTVSALAQQGVDMAAVQRWSNAKVVRYHVEGVHQGWESIAPGQNASNQGDVADRLTIDFEWDLRQNKLVGTPTFVNTKATVGALRNSAKECPAPKLRGEYEHLTVTGVTAASGQPRVELNGTRVYPDVDVADQWPASRALHPFPGKTDTALEYLPVPNPMLLAVRGANQPNLAVGPDGKTFIAKVNNWTWTYTPSLVQ